MNTLGTLTLTTAFTATLVLGTTWQLLADGHVAANPDVGGAAMMVDRDIIDNAVNSPIHTTLVAAVQAADLVETLKGPGPFTVFAPTDTAFAALPDGTVETLLKPENKAALQEVLTCHVVAANALSDVIGGMIAGDGGRHPVETVGGCTLQAFLDGDTIKLEDETGGVASVTIADVVQSNGVIHVIDAVLLPGSEDAPAAQVGTGQNPTVGGAVMFMDRDIVSNAVNSPIHTTLVAAVQAAGLVETLQGPGPFTVFAPTDDAFAALPAGTVETLLKPENLESLQKILTAHVVPGRLRSEDLTRGLAAGDFNHLRTVSGDALSIQTTPSGRVFVYDENGTAWEVTTADVMQSNGVIHVVEGVLLPK